MIRIRPFVLLLAFAAAHAAESSVWRCGADGRSYSDSPCPGGRQVAVADPRSDDQRAQARDVARKDEVLARELVQQRRERDAELRTRGPGLVAIRSTPSNDGGTVKPRLKAKEAKEPKMKSSRPAPASRPAARGTSPTADRAIPPPRG